QCKLFTGAIDDVVPLVKQAMRLSPREPHIFWWYFEYGRVSLLQSHTDEAILWLERARNANPALAGTHIFLASAYGLKGETDRAAAELAEARKLTGDGSFSSIAEMKTHERGTLKTRDLYEATLFRRSAQGRHAGGVIGGAAAHTTARRRSMACALA